MLVLPWTGLFLVHLWNILQKNVDLCIFPKERFKNRYTFNFNKAKRSSLITWSFGKVLERLDWIP